MRKFLASFPLFFKRCVAVICLHFMFIMANAQLQIDFLENGRGGHYLLHAGYKYSIQKRRNDRVYWRCVLRQCAATLITLNSILVSLGQNHNHPTDTVSLAADAFINNVKKRCREEVSPIPTIFDEELGKLRSREYDDDVGDMIRKIPTFESCRAALYRTRSKVIPRLPATQQDINLEGSWTETPAGERFLLCDDTNDQNQRILIFATDDNLRRLCDLLTVFGDGTFYSCPGLFYQLYSLHGSINSTSFPLVFALLPNKTEKTYYRFLNLLKTAITDLNLHLTPDTVMLDFEVAVRNAVTRVLPQTTVKACFFSLHTMYMEEDPSMWLSCQIQTE